MGIKYSLDGDAERRLNWVIRWMEIIRNNSVDFYYDSLRNKELLFVSIHAIGLIFPIAIVVNGQLITEDDIEPSQEAFDAFFTAAMCDVETIPISDGDKVIDAFYTTSIKKLKQQVI